MKTANIVKTLLVAFYLLLWIGGVFTYTVYGAPPPDKQFAGPLFLATGTALVLMNATGLPRNVRNRIYIGAITTGLLGYGVEVLGVHTGFPFGEYHYTEAFRPLLLRVPIIMTCAWILLSLSAFAYVRPVAQTPAIRIITSALVLTAIDLVLDPAAVDVMHLWVWHNEGSYYGIPVSNFLGWFLTALVVSSVWQFLLRNAPLPVSARWMGINLLVFFGIINLSGKLWLPAALSLLIALAAIAVEKRLYF